VKPILLLFTSACGSQASKNRTQHLRVQESKWLPGARVLRRKQQTTHAIERGELLAVASRVSRELQSKTAISFSCVHQQSRQCGARQFETRRHVGAWLCAPLK